MFSTAARISFLTLAVGLMVSVVPAQAESQKSNNTMSGDNSSLVKASGAEADSGNPDSYKFNTDSAPVSTDRHPPMRFSDPGETPLGQKAPEYVETVPDEAPYQAYIGYPKNQLGAFVQPMNLSAQWTFNGSAFNFSSTPIGMGLDYRLEFTPQWKMEIEYMHDSMSTSGGQAGHYLVEPSSQSYDTYGIKGRYCFLGLTSFFRQFCGGLDVGNDAYPILKFQNSATNLILGEVQDIVLGLNISYKQPFSDRYLMTLGLVYNYGTGIGNSGDLTSKNNSSYGANAEVDYNMTEHNTILVKGEYMSRTAKISGVNGSQTQTWQTTSTMLGLRIGYLRTF